MKTHHDPIKQGRHGQSAPSIGTRGRYPVLMLLFLCAAAGLAQEFSLGGRVLDGDQNPLPFANVLLKTTDSVVVAGTATDDGGHFIFDNLAPGRYLLQASYIRNTSGAREVEVREDTQIGNLIIQESAQQLEGVTVTYKKPKLERKVDRLVFNVANTAIVDGTLWELLKATPSVTEVKGMLSVKGNTAVRVMINGRPVNLPREDVQNLLSGTSASSVAAIEVITNPPAKYSAEDGVLIDIKMDKNVVAGYNGALFNRYRQGVFAKHTVGTDQFFKGKKLDFSVNYSFTRDKWLTRYTDNTNFMGAANQQDQLWTANQDRTQRRQRHNVSAFLDYKINDRNTLSFSTINALSPKVNTLDDSRTLITGPNADLLSSFTTANTSFREQANASFYGDWVHKLKKEGAEVSVNAHYTYYDDQSSQDLQTDFLDLDGALTGENDFTTLSQQTIHLFTAQVDHSLPLGDKARFETGLRYAGIASESTILQEGFDRNQPGINPTEAGVFNYDEDIYAGYVSYDNRWEHWRLRTGLRAEHTETLGDLDIDPEPIRRSYLEWFPSLSLQYNKSEQHSYVFQYYRRIQRPRYNTINPFQYFQNNFTVAEGNPALLPTISTRFSLGYTFDDTYTLEFIYDHNRDRFREQVFQDNASNLLRFVNVNLERNYSYGLDFTFDKDIAPFWNSYVLFAYFFQNDVFTDLGTGLPIENSIHTFIARSYQTFTFLEDQSLLLDLSFYYGSPMIRGNQRIDAIHGLDLMLRKSIWNKAGSISIGVTDIFNRLNVFSRRQFLDQDNTTFTRQENRLFTFGFRYKFGNTGIRDNYKRKRVSERNRL
ncbi:outer membrane beta-barrel protein [Maribacter sp. 2307ULW6-5]|uniref:outer membrane beta-barrel protein n=1 Tax=Maribacter sp. 2307ULW6-5 TaxID=3386275 RepID=UPI0039BCF782